MSGHPQGGVFVSYRHEESSHLAGRLADRLVERFGTARVFMDVESLEPGVDFSQAIQKALDSSDVLLAVIGPRWATITDASGTVRLHDPDDYVAQEVQAGLSRGNYRVIPVLVDGAALPREDELPEPLGELARRQAVRLDHETFQSDVSQLINRLSPVISGQSGDGRDSSAVSRFGTALSRRRAWWGPVIAVLMVIGAVQVIERLREPGADEEAGKQSSAQCGPVVEEFSSDTLDPAWSVMDNGPVVVGDERLEMTAEDGADVRADIQGALTAPWVSRTVRGSFTVETSLTVSPQFTYQGAGLLLYRDRDNYVRLERGYGNTDAIVFEYASDGRHIKVHGPFAGENVVAATATSVELRLQRRGTSVTAAWRPAGSSSWQELGGAASIDGDADTGVTVLNRSQPPEGDPERRAFTAAFDRVVVSCLPDE